MVTDPEANVEPRGGMALVTGAGSGIGRATTLRLAEVGYDVVGLDRDDVGLRDTAGLAHGGRVITRVVDLADVESLESAVAGVVADVGLPDLLVNNAGVGVAGTVAQTSSYDWDRTLAVNLTAVFHMCRLLVPPMVERGHGIVVNVASIAGLVGLRNRAAYCASKAGVVGLTRALAADHAGQGLRVNAICPGTVETAWVDRIIADAEDPESVRASMAARQLDGRMGTPEEVAAGILFLASPEARFVNGSAFVMDGGLTAV
jgi:NAD(P)-dependent dehydrogenase (short-subunit alcohol dehydrogenase family)